MNWTRITVKTTTAASDVVADIVAEISPTGVIIEDRHDVLGYDRPREQWDYVDEHLADSFEAEVCVRGFTEENHGEEAAALVCERLARAKANNPEFDWGTLTVLSETVKDENWAENWKKFYKPFKAGKKIVIKPSWEEYEAKQGELVLEMDPGAAFGTGSHETTKMCICLLEEFIGKDSTVIDVGCGTGVLAMCASLLGAKDVCAIDLDPAAVTVAKKNASEGNFNIKCVQGNLLEGDFGACDVVVANIIANAVMALAPAARKHLNENGVYITSGIINERADEVQSAIAANGFTLIKKMTQGSWTAFAWRKQ